MQPLTETQSRAGSLRHQHPRFTYDSVSCERVGDELKLRFKFSAGAGIRFEPETTIGSIDQSRIDSIDPGVLRRLAFHLGLTEMLSYWKATCSPEIVVRAGSLTSDQVAWWKDLIIRGMGEFFYVNQIDFTHPGFLNITADAEGDGSAYYDGSASARTLVLSSGGKDSALTLQVLREAGTDFNCLMLNPLPAAAALVSEAGRHSPIIVRRTIDPRLLELNKLGYLNGHTPFSALLSFLGVACAVLFDYGRVIVSNERSSNEGNVEFLGAQVNHQYSKTFDFEQTFREYSRRYLAAGVDYFSLLRPLYEIQIIRMIAGYPKFLPIFKSCNRNQLEGTWCGRCPKCISVFTLFYPFLAKEELIRTFGVDFFEGADAIPLLKQLAGSEGHKPFECVGTHEETMAALFLGVQRARKEQREMPAALRFVEQEILPRHPEAAGLSQSVLSAWSSEHNLPVEYERLLQRHLKLESRIDERELPRKA